MTATRRCQRATATAILALAVPALRAEPPEPAAASDDPAPRTPVRRIAASFNFEEEDNPYPVPRHWVWGQDTAKVPRPGFPRFNQSEFDFAVARSGAASVRLSTRGGSTSLRLGAGAIPVFAEGDYAVTAWVRTAGLQHSRAFMCARLLDQNSQPLPGTEVRTEPQETGGEWTEISVQLIGTPTRAAYLQVELQLLQPRQFESSSGDGAKDDAHRVWNEDLSGSAWFDDIVVYQLPRVEITSGAGANIILMPSRPAVQILVRDFVGERLDGHIVVTDIDDRVIHDVRTPLATAGRPQEWVPALPAFGWYRVSLAVLGEKPDGSKYRVGGAEMSLLWLGPASRHHDGARSDRARFGIVADRIEADIRSALPAVGRTIETGFTTIPLWNEGVTRADIAATIPAIGRTIDELSQAAQQVIISIPFIPGEILAEFQLDPANPLALADIDASKWMPFLQPVLDRYGQRLTRWQIGRAGIDGAFWHHDVVAAADKFGDQLATLVPGPRVAVPWRAEFSLPPGVPLGRGVRTDDENGTTRGIGTLVMNYPAEFDASGIRTFVEETIPRLADGPETAPAELVIVPELPPTDVFGERAAVIELARRTIEFWAARSAPSHAKLPLSLAISHPWRRLGEHRAQLMPAASLGALRTLIDHLAGRQIVGEYKVTPGVKCYILADLRDAPEGAGNAPRAGWSGALVAWNETAAPDDAVIHRFLGDATIEVVDLFGNRTRVERTGEPGGPHAVRIGETPVFIEGADPMLATFCSELRADPSFLPAVQTEHDMALVLTNPWPQAITGKLQIIPPENAAPGRGGGEARRRWTISPDGIIQFSLGAGQTKRIPWSVAFPYFEETGEKKFSVVVRLATDRELPPIVIPLTIQVGLQDLAIEPDVQLGPRLDGPDVIITASVSNRGQRSRMLKLEAVASGIPTHQTLIADLPPGEVVIKRIVLKNAAAQLSGKRVHLSLSDTEDQERLNTSVRVP